MDCKLRPRGRHNLLFLGARELAEYSLRHSSWMLYCQGIHEHVRRGRHFEELECLIEHWLGCGWVVGRVAEGGRLFCRISDFHLQVDERV